ncbi:MAG: class I SAM-dependent methyltransferase [Anaerolineae bacterium]
MKPIDWSQVRARFHGSRYCSREGRQEFVAHVFKDLLVEGDVLDVGCFEGHLGRLLPTRYVGVDRRGRPTVLLDLEQGTLPFADGSFATVVCTDVLEHLEHLHEVFDECVRVSSAWVILSLPNCCAGCWPQWPSRRMDRMGKYYGLPVERPIDRHRWYFSASQAEDFVRQRCRMVGASVAFMDFTAAGLLKTGSRLLRNAARNQWVRDLLATSVWAVLAKQDGPASRMEGASMRALEQPGVMAVGDGRCLRRLA